MELMIVISFSIYFKDNYYNIYYSGIDGFNILKYDITPIIAIIAIKKNITQIFSLFENADIKGILDKIPYY